MAIVDEALDRMHALMGQPLWEPLNKNIRLQFLSQAINYYAERQRFTRQPLLVKPWTATVYPGMPGQVLPDDFVSLYLVSTLNEGRYREIDIIDITEGNFFPPDIAVDFPASYVAQVAVRGSGADARLLAYPGSASGSLSIWYRHGAAEEVSLSDEIPAPRQFHLGLIPVYAALIAIPTATWFPEEGTEEQITIAMGRNQMRRGALLDGSNPNALPGLLAQQEALFDKSIHQAQGSDQPFAGLSGFGARRARRRGQWR